MQSHKHLDPRARPPDIIQSTYKSILKQKGADYILNLLDLGDTTVRQTAVIAKDAIVQACLAIERDGIDEASARHELNQTAEERLVYEHESVPGLLIVPSLLPPRAQKTLLARLLHRDLSNPDHLTNVHFHHRIPYSIEPSSFFSLPRDGPLIEPLDTSTHKPIAFETFMTKKLRWATLGGQYDWSAKVYPSEPAPVFPLDVAKFLETLFPTMKAEAAILNLYSPGDVLSMHRDIAEESDKGLISISIGCDAVFLIGLDSSDSGANHPKPLAIRLQSGDAVFMGGQSRFAWHGVPKIIPDTCPEFLKDWPADGDSRQCSSSYEQWRGWMAQKRINLNVRQMWD